MAGPIGEDQSSKPCRLCADKAFSRLIELLVLSITRQTQAVPRPTLEKRERKKWVEKWNERKRREREGEGGRKKEKGKDEARTMREVLSWWQEDRSIMDGIECSVARWDRVAWIPRLKKVKVWNRTVFNPRADTARALFPGPPISLPSLPPRDSWKQSENEVSLSR